MVIIYKDESNQIVVIYPSGLLSLEQTARKDVPAGLPYKFVNEVDLPAANQGLGEADFSVPDGFGIGATAWFAEQELKS